MRCFRWCRRPLVALSLCAGGLLLCVLFGFFALPRLLPKPLLLVAMPYSQVVGDARGTMLRLSLSSDEKYRLPMQSEKLNPHLVSATLLYEDRYFYQHPGVNPFSLLRGAYSTYIGGGRRMGGSTIAMQVARLRGGPEGVYSSATLGGKLEQLFMALRLGAHYSKEELLAAYFNLAPYGYNIEGVEAAAQVYFHKPAAQLTLGESVLLAVIPQNPGKRVPTGSPAQKAAHEAARQRLAAAYQQEYAPQGEAALSLTLPVVMHGPAALPFAAPHVVQYVMAANPKATTLRTTVRAPAQRVLEEVLGHFAQRGERYGLRNAAALLVHWPTMEVHASVGSAGFSKGAIQGQIDGTRVARSPGSTLKPFIYGLAAEQGLIHPMSLLVDAPRGFTAYSPENFDKQFQGPLPAHMALKASRNIPAISLALRLQHPNLYDFLQRAGTILPFSQEHYGLSLVLGGAEIPMQQLVAMYASLANQGMLRPLVYTTTPAPAPGPPVRLLSPEAAFLALDMLAERTRAVPGPAGPVPVYLKTGTSNGFRDAWTVGVFGPYVLAVWAGNFDNSSNPMLIGSQVAMPLFEEVARGIGRLHPLRDLVQQNAHGLNLTKLDVCAATGDTDISLCPEKTSTWFIPGVSPIRSSGVFRTILVDAETGLRACVEGEQTRQEVWEFWPSDLRRIFLQAGIVKPEPPEWMPGCGENAQNQRGLAPEIRVPRAGVVYRVSVRQPERYALPLMAEGDADTGTLHWFYNNRYLGASTKGQPMAWVPPPGAGTLRVVDEQGRASVMPLRVDMVE